MTELNLSFEEQLEDIKKECLEDNWNKQEYKAVRELQIRHSVIVKRFLNEDSRIPVPFIMPCQNGDLGYSWAHKGNTLMMVIGDDTTIMYSGVINGEKVAGKAKSLIGTLPGKMKTILRNLRRAEAKLVSDDQG